MKLVGEKKQGVTHCYNECLDAYKNRKFFVLSFPLSITNRNKKRSEFSIGCFYQAFGISLPPTTVLSIWWPRFTLITWFNNTLTVTDPLGNWNVFSISTDIMYWHINFFYFTFESTLCLHYSAIDCRQNTTTLRCHKHTRTYLTLSCILTWVVCYEVVSLQIDISSSCWYCKRWSEYLTAIVALASALWKSMSTLWLESNLTMKMKLKHASTLKNNTTHLQ